MLCCCVICKFYYNHICSFIAQQELNNKTFETTRQDGHNPNLFLILFFKPVKQIFEGHVHKNITTSYKVSHLLMF